MSEFLSPIFQTVLVQSGKAALVICAILLFHRLMGKRLSPTMRYLLWLLVPLTLVCCVPLRSPLSVYNLLPDPVTETEEVESVDVVAQTPQPGTLNTETLEIFPVTETHELPFTAAEPTIPEETQVITEPVTASESVVSVSWKEVFSLKHAALLWLGGCGVMMLVFLRQGLICRYWIRQGKQVSEQRVMTIFQRCAKQMKVKTWLVVAESAAVSGPFLIGAVRPMLLLPEEMVRDATDEQLRTVFLHELAHLKRWDVWVAWIMTFLLIVHWFNPLLWLALRRLNDAREEAADVLALQTLDGKERKGYGLSLVDITAQFHSPRRMPGLVGISESGRFLTRRIEMIRQIGTWKPRWGLVSVLFALLLCATAITDAQQPSKPGNIVLNGVEYAPVVKETSVTETEPVAPFPSDDGGLSGTFFGGDTHTRASGAIDFEKIKWCDIPGGYYGREGDNDISILIGELKDGVYPITIHENGSPYDRRPIPKYDPKDDDKYVGTMSLNADKAAKMSASDVTQFTIALTQKFDGEKEEPVEPALRNLKGTIVKAWTGPIEDGRGMTGWLIGISKNNEWDVVHVQKFEAQTETEPVAPFPSDHGGAGELFFGGDTHTRASGAIDFEKIKWCDIPGGYIGTAGDKQVLIHIGEEKNEVNPITIFLPEEDDVRYDGVICPSSEKLANISVSGTSLFGIGLHRKSKGDEGQVVELTLQNTHAEIVKAWTGPIEDGKGMTGWVIQIPASEEWGAIRAHKLEAQTETEPVKEKHSSMLSIEEIHKKFAVELPGVYLGTEGDDVIGIVIEPKKDGKYPVMIYENGLPGVFEPNPGLRYDPRDDKKYTGTITPDTEDIPVSGVPQFTIALTQKFDGPKEEQVENELRKLTMEVLTRPNDNVNKTALIIRKNREWDEVKVAKYYSSAGGEETARELNEFSGKYIGLEGDDRIGMIIGEAQNGVYPITIYEDGLPGLGFNERDDDKYVGTVVREGARLNIRLDKKFEKGRAKPVEAVLQKLTGIARSNIKENNLLVFAGLQIEIPANSEWDDIKLMKYVGEIVY